MEKLVCHLMQSEYGKVILPFTVLRRLDCVLETTKPALFIRSQNVYDEGLFLDDVVFISPATDEEMSGSRVRPGDILLNITGASIGRTCLVPDSCTGNVNQHVSIIRLSDAALRSYVAMFIKSAVVKGQIDVIQTGAAREGLNYAQISKLAITVPPLPESSNTAARSGRLPTGPL